MIKTRRKKRRVKKRGIKTKKDEKRGWHVADIDC